ncbi:MAG: hypothetical protein ABSD89_02715 [Halobacteriota archaeon]
MASKSPDFEYKPQNKLISIGSLSSARNINSQAAHQDVGDYDPPNHETLATLALRYSKKELASYTEFRVAAISKASIPWMKRCSLTFWNATKGAINKERCDALREHLLPRSINVGVSHRMMNFATAFLKYLAKTRFDTRYQAFELFLEMPKGLRARKHVTSRIVTKEDVENVTQLMRGVLPEQLVLQQNAHLYYQIVADNNLNIRADLKNPKRGDSAFQTDLCIFLKKNDILLPKMFFEFKGRDITTHDIITYSNKAKRHKQIYPYLRYGLISYERSVIPKRFFIHKKA